MSEQPAARPRRNAFRQFLSWWLEGLSLALQGNARRVRPWSRLLVRSAEGVSIYVRRRGKVRHVRDLPGGPGGGRLPARARARRGDVSVLRLASDQVLRHRMRIPRAARDVIDPVVRNQLERLVPWPADDLVYGYEVSGGDAETGDVPVTCVATSARRVAAALAEARTLGFEPQRVDVAQETTAALGIPLTGVALDRARISPRRIGQALVLAAFVAAVIGGAGLWRTVRLHDELALMRANVGDIRSRVAETRRLEEENSALIAERERLVALRASEPAMVAMLEALSKSLPDHAHLDRLEIRESEAELRGRARDAASLMAGLEKSPAFSDARFSAPTTREAGGERFAITLRLEREAGR